MKKFFATFAFAAVMMFAAFAPRAHAEVNIGVNEAYFDQAHGEIVLYTTVENTINQPVHLREFQVNQLTIYDADHNPIWTGSVDFTGLNVPIGANGAVRMTFTIANTTPPDYNGKIFVNDDSLVMWTAD